MASNVVVLLANAKKQIVKTTPTMSLKQVVNIVCEKQGYKDVESYGLKLNRTTLDLGLSMRFANLAPGAKLELIKVTAPKVQKDVQIALQLDDGGRMIGKFPIITFIWDILLHFEKTSDDRSLNLTRRTAPAPKKKGFSFKNFGNNKSGEIQFYLQPVCLILNREYGTISSLKSTTLQSVGITSGNALLRLLFRQTELTLDQVIQDIEASPQTSEVLESVNTPIKIVSEIVPAEKLYEQSNVQTDITPTLDEQPKEPIDVINTLNEQPVEQIDTVNTIDEQSKMQIDTVDTLEEPSNMQIDTVNVHDEEFTSIENNVSENNVSNNVSENIVPENIVSENIVPENIVPENIVPESSVSETNQSVLSSVAHKAIDQENNLSNASNKGHFNRDVKVFNPLPENALISNTIDLPDSFYELTASELQYLLAKQTLKHKMEENAGFKTKAMREQEEKEKERKYPKTLIRVKFPDGFQLQIAFLSKEHVSDLYTFVKSALRTPGHEFELYVSPPKKTLSNKKLTLFQAGLTPASIVYFIWTDRDGVESYLSDEYLEFREDIPNLTITENVSTTFIPKNSTIKLDDAEQQRQNDSSDKNRKSKESKERAENSSSSKLKMNVPKWFKKPK